MIRLRLTQIELHGKPAYRITYPQPDGTRKFRTFTDKVEAAAAFELAEIEQQNHGISMLTITDRLRSDAVHASGILAPFNVSLTRAAQYYADHHKRITESETVENAVAGLLAHKQKKSAKYREDLKSRLGRFTRSFEGRKIGDIQRSEILAWLSALGLAPLTIWSFRLRLSALWEFARIQGWVAENIIEDIPTESNGGASGSAIGILTVEEFSSLLEFADVESRPFWIFGGFCGIRSAELWRLSWDNVHWQSKLVEVPASKSKTASRRFVELRPNVLAWLAPYRTRQGPVAPRRILRKKLLLDRENAGITEWKPNCLRHSFASYHLAHFKNANALALEMGHTASDLIFKHYRELVLPIDAAKFWKLAPAKASKKVVAFA